MTFTALRDLNQDQRVWTMAASVELHKGETQHWDFSTEGVLHVSVVTHQFRTPITAVMQGGPVWWIPPIGTEVVLGFDNGEFEGDAFVVGIHAHAPTQLVPGLTLVLNDHIEIRSSSGAAVSVAKLSNLERLADDFYSHAHTSATPGSPTTTPVTPPAVPMVNPGFDGTQKVKLE